MKLITLDLASRTGWTAGPIDCPPVWGHFELSGSGRCFGRRMWLFESWLHRMIDEHEPDELVYEKPIIGRGTTLESRYITIGLATHTEKVCYEHGVRYLWVDNKTAKKEFSGSGNATKDDMIAAARVRGFKVLVHDEADALAVRYVRMLQLDETLAVHMFDPLFQAAL